MYSAFKTHASDVSITMDFSSNIALYSTHQQMLIFLDIGMQFQNISYLEIFLKF